MGDNKEFNAANEIESIFNGARKNGSLKDSFLEHAGTYGIDEIELLFPEAKATTARPVFINNQTEWVNKILGPVHKLPFARVKAIFADITADTARAKGYIKSGMKKEEVFGLLKRTTDPTTIYKKQKLDRDDVVDITDFDVVSWIKEEMRMKLDEEIARAILIGDGRASSDPDKIDEECIRPVYNDADLFTIKVAIEAGDDKYEEFVNACVRSRKLYRGSGVPTLFTTEELVTELLLKKDSLGHRLYKSVDDIKTMLRVSDIVTMNDMIDLVREAGDDVTHNVLGVIVNLADYSVGTNKGGQVAIFDDFDIDYNQQKYLIETRCSGALTVPYSAMVIEEVVEAPAP